MRSPFAPNEVAPEGRWDPSARRMTIYTRTLGDPIDAARQRSIDDTVLHESGHALVSKDQPLASIREQGYGGGMWPAWGAAKDRDGIAPSRYAGKNVSEDFAETYRLFAGLDRSSPEFARLAGLMPNRVERLRSMGLLP